MITCDGTDLFGGWISTISADTFCCQVETAGRGMCLTPTTVIQDLLQYPGPKEVATVIYDPMIGGDTLLAQHRSLVDFLDRLSAVESPIRLVSALDLASREFGHFGDWRWAAEAKSARESGTFRRRIGGLYRSESVGEEAIGSAGIYTGNRHLSMHDSYAHSPLAD